MTIPAGSFGDWLVETHRALAGEQDADVACGTCTACCRASQFVHIGPDESDALAHIPEQLTFPAPLMPEGHVLMGYDEHGHCPMLVDHRCSIYDHRPRTCRTYDCRVFAATGIDVGEAGNASTKADIAARATRWRFDLSADVDQAAWSAVQAAKTMGESPGAQLPPDLGASTPTQQAVLVIEMSEAFGQVKNLSGAQVVAPPTVSDVVAHVRQRRAGARRR